MDKSLERFLMAYQDECKENGVEPLPPADLARLVAWFMSEVSSTEPRVH